MKRKDPTPNGLSALFDLIGELARKRRQLGERSFATIGFNHTEARLLTLLQRNHGEATQEALSNMVHIDRTNVSRSLQKLEDGGFLVKIKAIDDGRANTVRLTPKGSKAGNDIDKLRKEMARGFFGTLKEEEAARIVQTLRESMGGAA